ncbi:Uncharacterised protein [Mycobacteroides abscessus subsp. abscessus]|nr:Uncharacterised protein [Mycobacteroides abscessus subsp. abscessus]
MYKNTVRMRFCPCGNLPYTPSGEMASEGVWGVEACGLICNICEELPKPRATKMPPLGSVFGSEMRTSQPIWNGSKSRSTPLVRRCPCTHRLYSCVCSGISREPIGTLVPTASGTD